MILASGCFDGLHSGHVAYLQACLAVARDREIYVAIAPDVYIQQVKCRPPRWSQVDRAAVVDAIRGVTRTVLHAEPSIAETILRLRPELVIKGVDWVGRLPADVVRACVDVGAQVIFVEAERRHCEGVAW